MGRCLDIKHLQRLSLTLLEFCGDSAPLGYIVTTLNFNMLWLWSLDIKQLQRLSISLIEPRGDRALLGYIVTTSNFNMLWLWFFDLIIATKISRYVVTWLVVTCCIEISQSKMKFCWQPAYNHIIIILLFKQFLVWKPNIFCSSALFESLATLKSSPFVRPQSHVLKYIWSNEITHTSFIS